MDGKRAGWSVSDDPNDAASGAKTGKRVVSSVSGDINGAAAGAKTDEW